jgi:hypothetical protein
MLYGFPVTNTYQKQIPSYGFKDSTGKDVYLVLDNSTEELFEEEYRP